MFSAHDVTALTAGDTLTVTHPSVAARAVSASEYGGLAAALTRNMTQGATGAGTAAATPAGTTTYADTPLLGAFGVNGPVDDTFTQGASYTVAAGARVGTTGNGDKTNVTANPEYRIVSATGSYTAAGTLSTSRDWGGLVVAYRAPGRGDGILAGAVECDEGLSNGTSSCCLATCTVRAAGQTCRAAAGVCDVAETCDGYFLLPTNVL